MIRTTLIVITELITDNLNIYSEYNVHKNNAWKCEHKIIVKYYIIIDYQWEIYVYWIP